MKPDDVQRLTWSVSERPGGRSAGGDRAPERAFDELVESCGDLCQRNFPQDDGYEAQRFELSGPVQGARFVVRRGRLEVVLSVQRFERAHAAERGGKRPVEIRLVSSMGMLPVPGAASEGAPARFAVAGCALGTLGISALALGSVGLVSAWVQAALLIPALIAWRTFAAVGMAKTMRRQAALGEARMRSYEEALIDALPRWQRMAPALTAERDLIGERLGLPPFRHPARALRASSSAA